MKPADDENRALALYALALALSLAAGAAIGRAAAWFSQNLPGFLP